MSTANPNKLKVKDIITVVLLALINVVIFFASSVLLAMSYTEREIVPLTVILEIKTGPPPVGSITKAIL